MTMNNADILAAIDEQIQNLQEAKALLEGKPSKTARGVRKTGRTELSAEARANIAAAQKARWVKFRKAAKKQRY